MTRAEVAKAIGRSIATVRRMEGKELHPDVDWNGVHQFDPLEVEEVAAELRETGRRRPENVVDLPGFLMASRLQTVETEKEDLAREVTELRQKVEELSEVDQIGARLLKIAGEALNLAEGAGCREAKWLRLDFRRVLQSIPD